MGSDPGLHGLPEPGPGRRRARRRRDRGRTSGCKPCGHLRRVPGGGRCRHEQVAGRLEGCQHKRPGRGPGHGQVLARPLPRLHNVEPGRIEQPLALLRSDVGGGGVIPGIL
eukprot:1319812-Heterocapsa_arctica.AAC.1